MIMHGKATGNAINGSVSFSVGPETLELTNLVEIDQGQYTCVSADGRKWLFVDCEGDAELHLQSEVFVMRTGDGQEIQVIEGTVTDVRPGDCGMSDESWYVAQCPDGRWAAWSDMASQDAEYFDSEEEALQSWQDAAEAERMVEFLASQVRKQS